MTTAQREMLALQIGLEQADTPLETCRALPEREYGGGSFYATTSMPLSVAVLPATAGDYEAACSGVARYNARAAARRGHRHAVIDRADWAEDLHAIRSSAPERQGRPMPLAYMQPQAYGSDAWPDEHCARHLTIVHGVISDQDRLVAYAQIVQCGPVARFNTILGHAEYLDEQVVWLLVMELVKWHISECGAGYALYYTHDSGDGDGLRYFKERFRFAPARIDWRLT